MSATYHQVRRGLEEAAMEMEDQGRFTIAAILRDLANDGQVVCSLTNRINAKTNLKEVPK